MYAIAFCSITSLVVGLEACNLDCKIHKMKAHAVMAVKTMGARMALRERRPFSFFCFISFYD